MELSCTVVIHIIIIISGHSLAIWSLHEAHLIMPYLHCALTRAPPSVHHSLAGIGLLMHLLPLFSFISPAGRKRPPAPRLFLPPGRCDEKWQCCRLSPSTLAFSHTCLCSFLPHTTYCPSSNAPPPPPFCHHYLLLLPVRASFEDQDLGCSSSLFFSPKQVSLNSSLIY